MTLCVQWEKVKKAGIAPSPRTNFGLACHKKRAILFGGVTDQHGRGDHMYSSMHDELYQMNLETQRWYPIAVKAPAKAAAKKADMGVSSSKHPQAAAQAEASQGCAAGATSGDENKADAGSARLQSGTAATAPSGPDAAPGHQASISATSQGESDMCFTLYAGHSALSHQPSVLSTQEVPAAASVTGRQAGYQADPPAFGCNLHPCLPFT